MRTDISIRSLKTGLWLFGLAALALLSHGGSYILLFTHILPGLVYGLVLAWEKEGRAELFRTIAFVLLSTVLYLLLTYKLDLFNKNPQPPSRLMLFGGIGSITLKLFYDLLLSRKFSIVYTLLLPVLFGMAGSVPGAISMKLALPGPETNEARSTLLLLGVFSVIPVWQYLFGSNIRLHRQAVSARTLRYPELQDNL